MMLIISIVMTMLPLLGVVWIFLQSSFFSVDGLFMTLILLAISGAFAGNALAEWKRRKAQPAGARNPAMSARAAVAGGAGGMRRGRVQSVEFFESAVGQPNKSVVVLADGADSRQTLILDGDVRNALPHGRRVEIAFRKEDGRNVLVDVNYA